ncbi:GH92 family glycosyl hydrolase [Mucilaginibacter sp. KACC 22063]|uniref:GH92 family glycosyl hydrolase n=1 Tax=Mucilaginibacter sp. KACC 22063 TaxID=3025666 RepID=UPI002366828C|nr:GH92 family glycosyl hydrolase [Mucilaginibacter sp. KACC 22063]WDF54015.1 GH92 family glycosyl hydrolase [Mucilaginibacter sp. KACC 22063]
MLKSLKFIVLSSAMLSATVGYAQKHLTKYVDPFIGTGGHGHTFPGAVVPFGMVQLSPDNGRGGWDWCGGYNYSDSLITGFSHMHLSGTGIGDWYDISVMPETKIITDTADHGVAKFSHKNEKASPGYYQVKLDNGINVALTTTERCGFHDITYPVGISPVVKLNLGFRLNWDKPTDTYIKQVNDSTLVGYRYSTGWAVMQRVYFAIRTSRPFRKLYLSENGSAVNGSEVKAASTMAQLLFDEKPGNKVMLKVALSTVNYDKATLALGEIKGWSFDKVKQAAENKWEKELAKIEVKTNDPKLRRVFYTALYHTCMAPALYSDADGSYQNAKGEVHQMPAGQQRYTEYSLWDTFRALNPLLTVTQDERYPGILNTMLAFYKETGLLPVWDLSANETNCMTGYHAVPVLADAILKGIKGIDVNLAYEAMKKSSMQDIRGTNFYRQYGYIPQDKYGSSVTVTLEYSYDDWCIAQVAKKLGKQEDYAYYMKRSTSWQNLFDTRIGFARAKNSDGKWVVPFDPYYSEHDPDKAMFTEGNSWQHTFFVPHDITGLAMKYGSYTNFVKKLDSLFTVSSKMTGTNQSPDVSGLIGQYAHGNEPSHHIAYMYDFVGQPWKTQSRVRMIIDSMYHDQPEGYAGNEDCGQMSAWAVWSIAGLYPVNPASGQYMFGSPSVDEVSFNTPAGKFLIKAKNNSKQNVYVQSTTLNGKPYNKNYITHQDLLKGGVLEFTMGPNPKR